MDMYSKCVLTVIALALSVIALQGAGVVPAWAQQQQQPMKVIICGGREDSMAHYYCADVVEDNAGQRALAVKR
jgi:hypothetical protein